MRNPAITFLSVIYNIQIRQTETELFVQYFIKRFIFVWALLILLKYTHIPAEIFGFFSIANSAEMLYHKTSAEDERMNRPRCTGDTYILPNIQERGFES